ncbi:MAG: TlpA disulfide reductase family protein [Verrucomicrobiota bacterium]
MTAPRALLIVLVGLLSTACVRLAEPAKPLDLKFTAIDGRPVDLAQLRGKVVLIDFWATWCAPCKIITPDMLALYKKYHDQGFDVVGMSVDTDKKAAQDYIAKEGIPWPEFFDRHRQEHAGGGPRR